METTVNCKKCGRVLKSPLSVAMGMGPKCAGISSTQGCKFHIGLSRSSGKRYSMTGVGAIQNPLVSAQPPERKSSRKEMAHNIREERRRLFEQRQAFQLGIMARSKRPLQYEPVGEQDWKDSQSGKVMSQEQLQAYLMRYQFI